MTDLAAHHATVSCCKAKTIITIFLNFAVSVCHYAIYWCDKLFFIFIFAVLLLVLTVNKC